MGIECPACGAEDIDVMEHEVSLIDMSINMYCVCLNCCSNFSADCSVQVIETDIIDGNDAI